MQLLLRRLTASVKQILQNQKARQIYVKYEKQELEGGFRERTGL